MDMTDAKRCGLQALLKQMHVLMAEGEGDKEGNVHELVEAAEGETGMGNAVAEADMAGEEQEQTLQELIKSEMKRGSRLPTPKGSMVLTVETKAKPAKMPAKAMKYG